MMEDFNFRRLAEYLLSLRFEILAAIEHEARRVDHPPSRRIGRRALAEHDMTKTGGKPGPLGPGRIAHGRSPFF